MTAGLIVLLLALAVAQLAALAGRRWILRRGAEGLEDTETTRWLELLANTACDGPLATHGSVPVDVAPTAVLPEGVRGMEWGELVRARRL